MAERKNNEPLTRVLPIVGLDVGAIGSILLSALVPSDGNSFQHQNKFLIFE
jgi:hypothetical protein